MHSLEIAPRGIAIGDELGLQRRLAFAEPGDCDLLSGSMLAAFRVGRRGRGSAVTARRQRVQRISVAPARLIQSARRAVPPMIAAIPVTNILGAPALASCRGWHLACIYLGLMIGNYALQSWTPQLVTIPAIVAAGALLPTVEIVL